MLTVVKKEHTCFIFIRIMDTAYNVEDATPPLSETQQTLIRSLLSSRTTQTWLVGPPGSSKTHTLREVALRYGRLRRPVVVTTPPATSTLQHVWTAAMDPYLSDPRSPSLSIAPIDTLLRAVPPPFQRDGFQSATSVRHVVGDLLGMMGYVKQAIDPSAKPFDETHASLAAQFQKPPAHVQMAAARGRGRGHGRRIRRRNPKRPRPNQPLSRSEPYRHLHIVLRTMKLLLIEHLRAIPSFHLDLLDILCRVVRRKPRLLFGGVHVVATDDTADVVQYPFQRTEAGLTFRLWTQAATVVTLATPSLPALAWNTTGSFSPHSLSPDLEAKRAALIQQTCTLCRKTTRDRSLFVVFPSRDWRIDGCRVAKRTRDATLSLTTKWNRDMERALTKHYQHIHPRWFQNPQRAQTYWFCAFYRAVYHRESKRFEAFETSPRTDPARWIIVDPSYDVALYTVPDQLYLRIGTRVQELRPPILASSASTEESARHVDDTCLAQKFSSNTRLGTVVHFRKREHDVIRTNEDRTPLTMSHHGMDGHVVRTYPTETEWLPIVSWDDDPEDECVVVPRTLLMMDPDTSTMWQRTVLPLRIAFALPLAEVHDTETQVHVLSETSEPVVWDRRWKGATYTKRS